MLFEEQHLLETGPDSIFDGWGLQSSALDWESRLPALSTVTFFQANPAFSEIFDNKNYESSKFIQVLGRHSVFSAVRNCVSKISIAWGYFSTTIKSVKLLFKGLIDTVSQVLDTVSTVMDSIEIAINSISWIPIVGWIVKIIFEIAKIVTNIISAIKEKQAQNRKDKLERLARQYALPMAEWAPEADTMLGRLLQMKLAPGVFDLEWAFMPQHIARSVSDIVASRQKYNPDDQCFSGWLIHSIAGEYSESGLGFVPGTMNIHGAVSLNTARGGSVQDYGDFFPVTRSIANQLWGQTVKGDSGMTFAIDTDKLINAWKEYVSSTYHYGNEYLSGWSMIAGDINRNWPLKIKDIQNLKYECSDCDLGSKGCDYKIAGKKSSKSWLTPPGDGHRGAYIDHLHKMFGWKTHINGKPLSEEEWLETMTPVVALRNLRARQEAMIRSEKCMYLDDSTSADGSGQPRFRAIQKGKPLHKLWDRCVAAMFESGDWKRIDYRDVIPGEEVDKAIRLHLSNRYRTTPEKYFNLENVNNLNDRLFGPGRGRASLGIAAKAGPTVLGDPKPPEPPEPIQVATASVAGMPTSPQRAPTLPGRAGTTAGRSAVKKKSAAPILIGAAAIGLLLMRNKK